VQASDAADPPAVLSRSRSVVADKRIHRCHLGIQNHILAVSRPTKHSSSAIIARLRLIPCRRQSLGTLHPGSSSLIAMRPSLAVELPMLSSGPRGGTSTSAFSGCTLPVQGRRRHSLCSGVSRRVAVRSTAEGANEKNGRHLVSAPVRDVVRGARRGSDPPRGGCVRSRPGLGRVGGDGGMKAEGTAWGGSLPMDQERGPLAGRIAGSYDDSAMHFLTASLRWKL
jgi:hypothetical protein